MNEPLTPRELEVLKLLADGKIAKEVGEALCISEKTVEKYRQNLKAKLAPNLTLAGMCCQAMRDGLIK